VVNASQRDLHRLLRLAHCGGFGVHPPREAGMSNADIALMAKVAA
jgi:hypothetical protein